jgi:hypothetical protein
MNKCEKQTILSEYVTDSMSILSRLAKVNKNCGNQTRACKRDTLVTFIVWFCFHLTDMKVCTFGKVTELMKLALLVV